MTFLGHIISSEDVEVDPKKTKAVKYFPSPLPTTNMRNFLDLAHYYRRSVDGFASTASPTLTQKNVKFYWLEACEKSFKIFKNRLSSARY